MINLPEQKTDVSRNLKRLGTNFAPQNQRLIGGVIATNSGPTRVEMTGRDNRLNIWKDGQVGVYMTESALVFQDEGDVKGGFSVKRPDVLPSPPTTQYLTLTVPGTFGLCVEGSITPMGDVGDNRFLGTSTRRWTQVNAVNGFFTTLQASNAATGSFTTNDGKTVTVSAGIITNIAS